MRNERDLPVTLFLPYDLVKAASEHVHRERPDWRVKAGGLELVAEGTLALTAAVILGAMAEKRLRAIKRSLGAIARERILKAVIAAGGAVG